MQGVSTVNWTELRHRMLRAVSAGRVLYGCYGREWNIRASYSTYVQMARAVNALWEAKAATGVTQDGVRMVVITDAGLTLLAEWNKKHGEVTS